MALLVSCTHCRKVIGVPEGALGRRLRCPLCQGEFIAVAPAGPAPAIPANVSPGTHPAPPRPHAARHDGGASPAPRPPRDRGAGPPRLPPPGAGRRLSWVALAAGAGVLAAVVIVVALLVRAAFRTTETAAEDPPAVVEDTAAGDWPIFADEGGGFRVRLPGQPRRLLQDAPSPTGNTTTVIFELNQEQPQRNFSVTYFDATEDGLQRLSLEKRFEEAREGARAAVNGRVVGERGLDLKGHPGRAWEIDVPGKGKALGRIYGVHRGPRWRLYHLVVGGPDVRGSSTEVSRFFDSFTLADDGGVPLPTPRLPPQGFAPPAVHTSPLAEGPILFHPPSETIYWLGYTPDGKGLITATWYGGVRLWDLERLGALPEVLVAPPSPIAVPRPENIAVLAHQGWALAVRRRPGKGVELLDLRTRQWKPPLAGQDPNLYVGTAAFSRDGQRLATVGRAGVQLWNLETNALQATLKVDDSPYAVAFSPDGATLATGHGHAVRLWDVETGKLVATLESPEFGFMGFPLTFTPDGRTLIVGKDFWDVATRSRRAQFVGGSSRTVSPDGSLLATGTGWTGTPGDTAGEKGKVSFWDLATARQRGQVELSVGIRALAYSPDGHTLAVATGEQVQFWPTSRLKLDEARGPR